MDRSYLTHQSKACSQTYPSIESPHEMQPHLLGAKASRARAHCHHQHPRAGVQSEPATQPRTIPDGGALLYLRHPPGLSEPALPGGDGVPWLD